MIVNLYFLLILPLLPFALQPVVGFGLSSNVPPFCPHLSPSSHSQHLVCTINVASVISVCLDLSVHHY
jgi:hypothetical protein